MNLPILTAAILALTAISGLANAAPHPGNPKELWVIQHNPQKPAEMMLAETLQGLTASNRERKIWLKSGGGYQVILDQMQSEGVKLHDVTSAWDLLKPFAKSIKGAIIYKLGTPSVNVAASLCGPMQCVAIDESMLDRAKSEGLEIIQDVRGMDDKACYDKYKQLFKHGTLINQSFNAASHLRDFGVARHSFIFGEVDKAFRIKVCGELGPQTIAYGWGREEDWVGEVSEGGATAVAADWNTNLSVLEHLPARKLKCPASPQIKPEDNVNYVAFVMSDGDNVQFMCGGFLTDTKFWASPLRGKFPMSWEISTMLAEVAPRILEQIYETATPNDGITAGPGLPGYTYLHYQPDRTATAKQSSHYLKLSGMDVVGTINKNIGTMEEAIPLLDLPEITGILYKDFNPYNRRKGAMIWHDGKPCLSYKFDLRPNIDKPDTIAAEVAKMPAKPLTDDGSYALVNVLAWAKWDFGGPMESVQRTIDLLPKNTRVVTANQLIELMRRNLGTSAKGSKELE